MYGIYSYVYIETRAKCAASEKQRNTDPTLAHAQTMLYISN